MAQKPRENDKGARDTEPLQRRRASLEKVLRSQTPEQRAQSHRKIAMVLLLKRYLKEVGIDPQSIEEIKLIEEEVAGRSYKIQIKMGATCQVWRVILPLDDENIFNPDIAPGIDLLDPGILS